jgi:hypothetical protein
MNLSGNGRYSKVSNLIIASNGPREDALANVWQSSTMKLVFS